MAPPLFPECLILWQWDPESASYAILIVWAMLGSCYCDADHADGAAVAALFS
jgi:hypothetical protein